MTFKVNEYIKTVLEEFYEVCTLTLDTEDFMLPKINNKLRIFIFRKTAKPQLRFAWRYWKQDRASLAAAFVLAKEYTREPVQLPGHELVPLAEDENS